MIDLDNDGECDENLPPHFDTCCDADFRNTDLLALGSEGPELG